MGIHRITTIMVRNCVALPLKSIRVDYLTVFHPKVLTKQCQEHSPSFGRGGIMADSIGLGMLRREKCYNLNSPYSDRHHRQDVDYVELNISHAIRRTF
jgi:hypothetical protein